MKYIAFYLLSFLSFQLSAQSATDTLINWDSIIILHLGEGDPSEDLTLKQRNLFTIRVDAANRLFVREQETPKDSLRNQVKAFIANPRQAPHLAQAPTYAFIYLKSNRATNYAVYLELYQEIYAAYEELWDEWCQRELGVPYSKDMDHKLRNQVKNAIPYVVAESNPE